MPFFEQHPGHEDKPNPELVGFGCVPVTPDRSAFETPGGPAETQYDWGRGRSERTTNRSQKNENIRQFFPKKTPFRWTKKKAVH